MKFDCNRLWKDEWHLWFAWFPVKVAYGDCRWLERVERKRYRFYSGDVYNYRAVNGDVR